MSRGGAPRDGAAGVARASSSGAHPEARAAQDPGARVAGSGRAVGAVLGALLCGGRSRRMGTDKALLVGPDGLTLLERAARTLEAVGDGLLLAVGPQPRYADHLRPGRRAVLDRPGAGEGPLAGLAAALEAADGAWLVTAAVDMPSVGPALLAALLERAAATGADLCLARGPRGVEPLLGAFGPSCAAVAARLLAAGERRPVALADPAHGLRATFLELPSDEAARSLTNLNTPEDWRAAAGDEPDWRRLA